MAVITEKTMRIEDIIALAQQGKGGQAEVKLSTRHIIEKALAEIGEVEDMDAYLPVADFIFEVAGETYTVSKTYLRGYKSESLEARAANQRIANARLKEDYKRLDAAGVKLERQFFEEFHI